MKASADKIELKGKIKLEKVTKSYGDLVVLDNFSLELPASGIVGISGPSGCGKTTLLRLLAGLEQADSGEITGLDQKRISVVFQEDRLLPWMNVIGNLAAVQPDASVIRYYLECMKLTAQAHSYPATLSGGMQRRVALARALAYGGNVFLLDEPFKGMDSGLKQDIFPHIIDAGRDSLLLLISHEFDDLRLLSDQIITVYGSPMHIQEKSKEKGRVI